MLELDEYFPTEIGNIKVIRVQDEFRVIRCIQDGPFHGCFVDILTVPRNDLALASWLDVEAVAGLKIAFLTPVAAHSLTCAGFQVADRRSPAEEELQRP